MKDYLCAEQKGLYPKSEELVVLNVLGIVNCNFYVNFHSACLIAQASSSTRADGMLCSTHTDDRAFRCASAAGQSLSRPSPAFHSHLVPNNPTQTGQQTALPAFGSCSELQVAALTPHRRHPLGSCCHQGFSGA